jgi:hypothetical protein
VSTATCDFRFSLQSRYASSSFVGKLAPKGFTNDAVTISGRATMAEREISEADFVGAKPEEIGHTLAEFLDTHGLPRPDSLVILDMEPEGISPPRLGTFDEKKQRRLIRAYARRIRVARRVLRERNVPGLKLGLYQVIVPDGRGQYPEEFTKRMSGYDAASEQGMYDRLDFICPVLYQRFGFKDANSDLLGEWIEASTRQGIDESLTLTRKNGTPIPLVPFLSFWVFNGGSKSNRDAVTPESVVRQLEIVQSASRIEAIVFWSGWQTKPEMQAYTKPVEPINIPQFLKSTGKLPWPGCT